MQNMIHLFPDGMGGLLHEALFGNYLKFNDNYTSEFNIWNLSRQPTFKSRDQ